ncbi:hypothetical protein HELRODRAFT_158962 [Helobdella robusta]|uniref:Uncharacterized protein n=1 Tax=Helobdella robusta TaxID=6412 RepID=T1ENF8_HELRO|nr:hypothetical protein HELRODRAFT_158962 [Helobdella robusta]ESO12430.1 hypothetical protein HELRODRAFT_158962 [Helobdella robusta]
MKKHLKNVCDVLATTSASCVGIDCSDTLDRYEDLVVGAPFYYEKGYSGAVYVYYNGPGQEGLSDSPQKLKGTKSSNFVDVRFGFAIACGGDLNQDGFDDLVVGAPFEDSGAIYIFHGSTSLLSLSQKVTVRDFVPISSMKLFGYAISKKFVDTDDNGYLDFLVGSYQSDSVVLLRTRPVVNIHFSAETSPKIIDPKNPLCTNSTNPKDRCFAVSFKYKYTWILENKRSNKDKLNVLLTASIDNALASRAKFHTEGYNKSWKLAVDTFDTNLSTYVYLTENNRDWLSPITLTYTYELVLPETHNRNGNDFGPMGSLEKHPVLNAKNPKTGLVEVHFLKECGDDDKCDSDLNLKLESPSFNKISGLFEFKFSEELKLDVVVTNHGEDAHQAFLYVNLTKGLTFRGKDATAASEMISCEYIEHASLLQCGVGNPLASHDVVHLRIRLSAKNLQTSLTHLNIEAFVNTTSNFDPSKTMANITFEKITESDLALIRLKMLEMCHFQVRMFSFPGRIYYWVTNSCFTSLTNLKCLNGFAQDYSIKKYESTILPLENNKTTI